ncbi:MAG: SpoVR family protein [Peptococcaceae bacterium]|nr:SpoVR family protein [Peptococcaceae bacterium]
MADELKTLEAAIESIAVAARQFGLDFFPVRFEICPADVIYTFGAYGMPTRFSHWSFGKAFHRMKIQYDYNLSRIYELVINSNPCYAFLLEGNSIVQNKLVIAHVLAHCDFFKNNATFRHTSRTMLDTMANSAERIRQMEFEYGRHTVEKIIDAAISLQEHVDARATIGKPRHNKQDKSIKAEKCPGPYEDLLKLGEPESIIPLVTGEAEKPLPEKDLLKFIIEHAKHLTDWQREVLAIIREEMLYFYPQMETKIMNEGWASYWHARIMREIDLTEEEAVEFAITHSAVIQPARMSLNPYFIGYKIWENIERRWEHPEVKERKEFGLSGGEGRSKMFEVRENENDVSFIRNYLTPELIEELDLYIYQKVGNTWQIVEKNAEKIRDNLVLSLNNCGFPYLEAVDSDYNRNGELLVQHCHEGIDLDLLYLERTLPSVYTLWGRTVHLATVMDGKKVIFSYNGERVAKASQ